MNYGHQLSAYPLNAFLVFSPPLIITHVSTHPFHQFIHKIYPKIQIFSFRVHTVSTYSTSIFAHQRSSPFSTYTTPLCWRLNYSKSSQVKASPRLASSHYIALQTHKCRVILLNQQQSLFGTQTLREWKHGFVPSALSFQKVSFDILFWKSCVSPSLVSSR